MKFDSKPLSGVLDKMISMLKSTENRDREEADLIGRNPNRRKKESFKKLMNGEDDFAATDKKWLFALLELLYAQYAGEALSGVMAQIDNLERISPLELGKCYQKPEGLRGWFLEK